MIVDLVGYLAGTLAAASQLPQAVKAWRSRSTEDLSTGTLVLLALGLGTWIAFGIGRGELPIILANGTSLAITLTILAAKLRYG